MNDREKRHDMMMMMMDIIFLERNYKIRSKTAIVKKKSRLNWMISEIMVRKRI